jgi:hypothetical protein
MHLPINVKSPNNISKWHMEFNSAFKGLIQWDSNRWIPAQLTPQLNSETGTSPTFVCTTSKTNQQRAISQLGTYTYTALDDTNFLEPESQMMS